MADWFLMAASGGLLVMAVYSITFFLFRKEEKASLYFTLFCIGNSVRFFMWDVDVSPLPLESLASSVPLIVRQCCVYLVFLGIAGFVFSVFGGHVRRPLRIAVMLAPSVFLLGMVDVFFDAFLLSTLISILGLLVLLFLVAVIARYPMRKTQRFTYIYLAVFILYIVSFLTNAAMLQPFYYLPIVTNYLFALLHLVLLSGRSAKALDAVEKANTRLEETVAQKTQELTASNASMKELVTAMSHDLKTPLTVMGLELEKLTQLALGKGDGIEKAARIAYSKGLDLQRLVQNLLDAGRLESGAVYELTPMPISRLLADMQERYGEMADDAGLFFDAVMAEDAFVMLDARRIWSVLDNIVYNALRYTKEGGITVTAQNPKNGTVLIAIEDTGSGVAQKHLPHLFQRFYKANAGRGGEDGDSGLGLYIVSSMMAGMGGTAEAESEEGKGFAVFLKFLKESC